MDVKEAVARAKSYIVELFSDEKLSNVGLEEVELDAQGNEWIVTIGFSRPWDVVRNTFTALGGDVSPRRSYKVVRIANTSGQISSVKNREVK